MAKKGLIIFCAATVIAAAGLGSWQFYFKDKFGIASGGGEIAYVTKVSSLTGEKLGVQNWYAGVVEPQSTLKVNIESGRKVTEVKVAVGDHVAEGDLLFEYDLSSMQDDLRQLQLDLDRLKNEAMSLNENINELTQQRDKADANSQLSYTISIETAKMDLRKNQYSQQEKQNQIDKLISSTDNTEVRATMAGVIQKIDTSKLSATDDGDSVSDMSDYDSDSQDSNAFITILATGNYRVKGTVNEQNRREIVEGDPVIIRSRADENQIWHGTMGKIDEQNAKQNDSDSFFGMTSSSGQTSSTSYPFYVDLDNSDDLMLGQHVYIERDEGQSERTGIWISEFYLVDADSDAPYVWADADGRLQIRHISVGEYSPERAEYQVLEGLSESDSIAYPDEEFYEGMTTADISEMPEEEIEEDWDEEDWEEDWDDEEWVDEGTEIIWDDDDFDEGEIIWDDDLDDGEIIWDDEDIDGEVEDYDEEVEDFDWGDDDEMIEF
ncbi:MAG: efflux RND transporter periplasmic adaptor subunit [Blautia sp.]|nr:efflux RND transporter periplasmic adaptor subunit [Blautia sp.]